jgi:hypothetical protein
MAGLVIVSTRRRIHQRDTMFVGQTENPLCAAAIFCLRSLRL